MIFDIECQNVGAMVSDKEGSVSTAETGLPWEVLIQYRRIWII